MARDGRNDATWELHSPFLDDLAWFIDRPIEYLQMSIDRVNEIERRAWSGVEWIGEEGSDLPGAPRKPTGPAMALFLLGQVGAELIDVFGEEFLIPFFDLQYDSTEELIDDLREFLELIRDELVDQYRDEREVEQARQGFSLGFPGGNMVFGNPFEDGWVVDCQYFVVLRGLGGGRRERILDNRARRWEEAMGGPIYSHDFIYPAWGPIVSVESDLVSRDGGRPIYMVYLRCAGLGVYPSNFGWGNPESQPYAFLGSFQFFQFLELMHRDQPGFTPFSWSEDRPHREIWPYAPRTHPSTFGPQRFTGTRKNFIFTPSTHPWTFAGILKGCDVEPWIYSDGDYAYYGFSCDPLPSPPPAFPRGGGRRVGGRERRWREEDMGCSCDDISRLIDSKLRPIYSILGFPQSGDRKVKFNPDALIKSLGKKTYNDRDSGSELELRNYLDIIAAIASANYHKAGLHRLPAEVPDNMASSDRTGNLKVEINDALEWQEWLLKQLDALIGQFPIDISVKNEDNSSSTVQLSNLAESIAEIYGVLLGTASDADLGAQLALRATLEASKAGNAALVAQDYAKANAQYLGYKGNPKERLVKSTISPGEYEAAKILEPSTQRIVGYEWSGDDSLQTALTRLLVAAGIIQAALVQKWEPGDAVTGDAIKADLDRDGENDREDWNEFLTNRRVPPANRRVPNAPIPEIKDLTNSQADQVE